MLAMHNTINLAVGVHLVVVGHRVAATLSFFLGAQHLQVL
jgi:hypothetical protein